MFPDPGAGTAAELAQAAVQKLMLPASEIGGDARLELPRPDRIKTEVRDIGGKVGAAWGQVGAERRWGDVHCTSLAPAGGRAAEDPEPSSSNPNAV